MAYTEKEKSKIIDTVCDELIEGKALRRVLTELQINYKTFYNWIDKDEKKAQQYARATELRAEYMAEEILTIIDATEDDIIINDEGKPITNHNVIQRDRLRADKRQWLMSKMMPKKYGDKLDVTSKGDKVQSPVFASNPLDERE